MSATPHEPPRAALASRVLVLVLGGIFLLGVAGFFVAVITASEADLVSPPPSAEPSRPPIGRIQLALAVAEPADGEVPPSLSPSASPIDPDDDAAASVGEPEAIELMTEQSLPVVPVARFWASKVGISRRDIVAALEQGKLRGYKRIIVEDGLRDALAETLAVEVHDRVDGGDVSAVEAAVSRGALGFLAAADVSPRVRALAVNGDSLYGNDRVNDVSDWPLLVSLVMAEADSWDQATTWVLVAGGDSFTDRGVYNHVIKKGRGVSYPFDGGTARVTGHGCCDPIFNDNVVPRYVLTGNKGAVRRLFKRAELAIANHEAPVTDDWAYHTEGLRFSGRPDLTRVFSSAGIDWVSLANNHIKDYGTAGIKDTRRILRQHDIAFGGAGKDLAQARRVSYFDVGETRIAIVPCVGVAPSAWAGPRTSGGTPCLDRILVPDIRSASRQADLVIVFPHWGVEYTRQPLPSMRKHASKWVRAGADLILGAHSHVAGAIEDIDGTPVLYSLGNLIFDQNWSTNTMESMMLEATFHGGTLAQLKLRPYIIHDQSQPNLLDPAKGEGRRLLQEVRKASRSWLDW